MNELVLVTGGTGFVGSHCILKLLNAGYRVRTTVRSLDRKQEVLDMLKASDVISVAHLSFIEADLMQTGAKPFATVRMYCMWPAR